MINLYADGEKNLRNSVLPTLEKLHKEIKAKAKELLEKALGLIQDAERKKQVEKYLAECI